MQRFFDTLLVIAPSMLPLDIATPHAASRLVADELARRTRERFVGRMASVIAPGPNHLWPLQTERLLSIAECAGFGVRHAVVLTDRVLFRPRAQFVVWDRPWLVFDWWQWCRDRIPARRWADAWMYLSLACPVYFASGERQQLGIDASTADAMRSEGERLLAIMTDEIASQITAQWRDTPTGTIPEISQSSNSNFSG